jgi:acetyl esterase
MPRDAPPSRLEILAGRLVVGLPGAVQRLLVGRPVRVGDVQLAVEVQMLLKLAELSGEPDYATMTVAEARASLRNGAIAVGGRPLPLPEVRDLLVAELPARLYVPDGAPMPAPLLVYFHGGGHVSGDLDSHDAPCRFLAREAGVRVLSIDYRRAPEHPFPAPVEDALAAFRYAVEHAEELGADPSRIGVGGDSAGANLAAVVAQLAVLDAAGDVPRPAHQLLVYPVADYSEERPSRRLFARGYLLTEADIAWYREQYLAGPDDARDPRVSPLLREDLAGLPPAHVVTAGFDPLRDEGEEFARRMRDAGVTVTLRRYPGTVHGFLNMVGLGERFLVPMREIAAALRWGLAGRP